MLAAGCGSSDKKKTAPTQAGAGGDGDPAAGGGKSDAGGPSGAGGASPVSGAGKGGVEQGGAPTAGAAGDGPATAGAGGEGGAPTSNACAPAGNLLSLDFDSEPIYQGCRGAVVRVPFTAEAGDSALTCCGSSTSTPAFDVELTGAFNDGSGTFEFEVPGDAPFGPYALEVTCQTNAVDPAFSLEINDADAPFVLSVSALIESTGSMLIQGQHLGDVNRVGAFRATDGAYYECVFAAEDQSDTSIECSFDGNIPSSVDENDTFVIDVASEDCGSAKNPPSFLVAASNE